MTITELVKKYDPENQFEVLKNSYQQIEFAKNNNYELSGIDTSKIKNIIVSGLGGSAISGDLILNFLQSEIALPMQVNRNYTLPNYAGESTLLLASSYSGNTEETISVLNEALKRRCQIICLTTGGTIKEIAGREKLPTVILQEGFQPRYSLGLSFFSLLKVLQTLRLVTTSQEIIDKTIHLWKKRGEEYSTENNYAFQVAEKLVGFLPVIYSTDGLTSAVGNRFKCQINENSKMHAFHNVFPELNHNEIIGWETYDERIAKLKAIFIEEITTHPQIKKRFAITYELLMQAGVEIISLSSTEASFQERLLDLIYLSDWISYYLAIQRGKDPSEIDYIHLLKKQLAKEA
ncbi:MAG: bifunctional phosphoglucose/phosphomannose isomerase [Ignavibacteriaceae bacterium]|nr:bifunctional phosphoglucose/phosphomannose isomerase [Ignavibacteriaceae bacterium]